MKDSRLMVKNIVRFCSVLFVTSFLFSCTTVMPDIPNDLTAREIVQRAQDSYNSGHDKVAMYYYDTLIARYGMDTSIYLEGKYEIAHIYIKAKNYSEAVPLLEEIISIYDNSVPGSFSGEYYKMAKNDLAKVPKATLDKIHEKQLKAQAKEAAKAQDLVEVDTSAENEATEEEKVEAEVSEE